MSNKDASFCTFVSQVNIDDSPIEDSYETIFSQYEKVVVQALVSSFGLDFLIQDQHGGDVDTIHNVREIGKDPEMNYKKTTNSSRYKKRGKYNSGEYHKESRDGKKTNFAALKSEKKKEYFENGNKDFEDEYTTKTNLGFFGKSKNAPSNRNAELDHIVEANAIHDDPGRVLAKLDGKKLADSPENFAWTNKSLNASMGKWANMQMLGWKKQCKEAKKAGQPLPPKPDVDMEAYIKAHPELDETTKANMREHYKKAKKAYDAKLSRVYYTSNAFWQDTGIAAAKLGLTMGLRQALGLVFTEIWFTVKDAIILSNKNEKTLFEAIAKAVKQGLKNAKKKFREIWEKFIEGAVAGVLSSLVTTLANIFFTTAKNAIKIIRESFASLSQASKILFINPDCYSLGDRFVAAAKVMATGASVIAGSMVKELLKSTPIAGIPIIEDVVPIFCSVLVTGIMSCSLLHILDHNKYIKKAVEKLDQIPDIDNFNVALTKQCELLDKYLAEFMKIDFDLLKQQEEYFFKASTQLSTCKSLEETNHCLSVVYSQLNIKLPWQGYKDFDSFMKDRKSTLVFS